MRWVDLDAGEIAELEIDVPSDCGARPLQAVVLDDAGAVAILVECTSFVRVISKTGALIEFSIDDDANYRSLWNDPGAALVVSDETSMLLDLASGASWDLGIPDVAAVGGPWRTET